MDKLKLEYRNACNNYITEFCKKQNFEFIGWVGDEVGGIALCSDLFFNLHDIIWDINSNQKKGVIVDWYDSVMENPETSINYHSYTKGLRVNNN